MHLVLKNKCLTLEHEVVTDLTYMYTRRSYGVTYAQT